MDGPERLEDDARPARRWTWLAVAVAVVVVATLGAVRLAGLAPDPARMPNPAPSTGRTPTGWPQGSASGTLYVLDAGGVVTIDVGSGLVQRSSLDIDPTNVTLTAGGFGVLVWPQDGAGTAHEVTPFDTTAATVTGELARARQFLPGPGLAVWASGDALGNEDDQSTWRLVDESGAVEQVARLGGLVVPDGAGGLFGLDDPGVRHVVPGQPGSSWRGTVSAVGTDGWEALRCTGRRCTDVLHDRTSGTESALGSPTPAELGDAALAPGNRFVAAAVQRSDSDDSPVTVRVSVPGQRDEVTSFTSSDLGRSFAWMSNRWLVGVGRRGLVLVDAVDNRTLHPDVGLTMPRQVVFRPA